MPDRKADIRRPKTEAMSACGAGRSEAFPVLGLKGRSPVKPGKTMKLSHFIEQLLRGDAVVFFEGFVVAEGAHVLNEFSEVHQARVAGQEAFHHGLRIPVEFDSRAGVVLVHEWRRKRFDAGGAAIGSRHSRA